MDRIIADTLSLYDTPRSVELRLDIGGAAPIAHGWYSAVRAWGRGALLLEDAGLYAGTAPLRRSMIEHGLALFWLAETPDDALASLQKAKQSSVGKLKSAMEGGRWNIPEEVLAGLLSPTANGSLEDTNLNFTHLCRRFGQQDLLVAWLHESMASHPSLASAMPFLPDLPLEEPVTLPRGVRPSTGREQVALLLLFASDGFNKFLTGAPWIRDLANLEERFRLALAGARAQA